MATNESYQEEVLRQSQELLELAKDYRDSRLSASLAQGRLDLQLAKYGEKLRGDRKTVSKENMLISLLEFDCIEKEENQKNYNDFLNCEADYKGLEKVLEALKTRIMALQSVMKYDTSGEYGNHD